MSQPETSNWRAARRASGGEANSGESRHQNGVKGRGAGRGLAVLWAYLSHC